MPLVPFQSPIIRPCCEFFLRPPYTIYNQDLLKLKKTALFRCCDAPQKIKKERKGEERRERKRRKEGKEERKRRKGKEGKEERKGRKGKGKKGERKRRGKEGEEVVTKVSRVDMGRA